MIGKKAIGGAAEVSRKKAERRRTNWREERQGQKSAEFVSRLANQEISTLKCYHSEVHARREDKPDLRRGLLFGGARRNRVRRTASGFCASGNATARTPAEHRRSAKGERRENGGAAGRRGGSLRGAFPRCDE